MTQQGGELDVLAQDAAMPTATTRCPRNPYAGPPRSCSCWVACR